MGGEIRQVTRNGFVPQISRTWIIVLLVVEGASVLVWWAAILMFATVRDAFQYPQAPPSVLSSFLLSDLMLVVVPAFLAASAVAASHRGARALLYLNAGGATYAALMAISLWETCGGSGIGGCLMIGLAVGVWALALQPLSASE